MKAIFLILLLLLSFGIYAQQPGTLDKSFGTGGISVTDFGKQTGPAFYKAVLQSDDKIIEGGYFSSFMAGAPSGPFASRYTADGRLDSSYGDGGKSIVVIPNETDIEGVVGFALTKEDELLISGYGSHGDYRNPIYDGYILKLKKDGSPDSSFGKNGIIQLNVDGYGSYYAIAVQDDGKILVLGAKGSGQSIDGFINRLLPDGTVDETFGDKGYTYISDSYAFFTIKVQPDSKILMGGYNYTSGITSFSLQRYLPDGMIDKAFGDGGSVITPYGDEAWIHDIGLQSDGKIVAAGQVTYDSPYNTYFATARYTVDGKLDGSFSTEGKATTMFGDSTCIAFSIVIQKDDKIILGGSRQAGGSGYGNFALTRLTSDGVPDSSFGSDGKAFTDSNTAGYINTVLLQSTGKIIGAGNKVLVADGGATRDGAQLARYNNDISKRQQIAIKIRRYLQHHGITWMADNNVRYYTVQRSLDGGVTYQPLVKLYNNHQSILTYEDASATSDNAVYRVAVVAKDGGRSFSNSVALTNEAGVRVFPNPVRSTLQVQGLPQSKSSLNITDFSGNVRTSVVASGGTASLNTSSLKPGNYLLKVQSGNTVETKAFVKE